MELEKIAGLPAHPLFAHLPVVIIPLAGILAILFAARPAWLDRFGWGLVGLSGVGMLGAILAAGSGEALEDMLERSGVGESNLLEDHTELGELARTAAVVFFVAVLAVVVVRSRAMKRPESGSLAKFIASKAGALMLGIVLALSAAGATVTVAAAGHKGAEAHWRRVEKLEQVGANSGEYEYPDDEDD